MKTSLLRNNSEETTIGKLICVGRNYSEHAIELGNEVPEYPLIFIKPSSAIIYSGSKIVYPSFSKEMHHEVELTILIGNTLKNAGDAECEAAIKGYGVGLDMTLRDVQAELKKKGYPWTIAKCFDTSAVLSDFVSTKEFKLSLHEEIQLYVNGEKRQADTLNKMIFKPVEILKYISSLMTIEAGDIIFTGTPAGVGKVNHGDQLHARIEGVAELFCEVS